MSETAKVVTLVPRAPFVLEMQSERMVDAIIALTEAGFTVTHMMDTVNRFKIEDEQELK